MADEKKGYAGKFPNSGSAEIKALHPQPAAKPPKVQTGKDLRTGSK